jgi:hypothetical protein
MEKITVTYKVTKRDRTELQNTILEALAEAVADNPEIYSDIAYNKVSKEMAPTIHKLIEKVLKATQKSLQSDFSIAVDERIFEELGTMDLIIDSPEFQRLQNIVKKSPAAKQAAEDHAKEMRAEREEQLYSLAKELGFKVAKK